MKSRLIPIPIKIPYSNGKTRQAMKVPKPGIKSLSKKINKYEVCSEIFLELTFGPPHWFNNFDFNHKYHSCYNNRSKRRFRNIVKTRCEKQESYNN